nr:MAG TPA_asm: hypothetical protein [Caudoviricetes sp.]
MTPKLQYGGGRYSCNNAVRIDAQSWLPLTDMF